MWLPSGVADWLLLLLLPPQHNLPAGLAVTQ
jgi:hypothetical protein